MERVFRDRMVSDTDMAKFDEFKTGVTKKYFEDLGMQALEQAPLLFTSFMQVRCLWHKVLPVRAQDICMMSCSMWDLRSQSAEASGATQIAAAGVLICSTTRRCPSSCSPPVWF